MRKINITSISRFHEKVLELKSESGNGLLYRGQACTSWEVDCSAIRRLKNNSTDHTDQFLVGYLKSLINKVRMRGFFPEGFDPKSSDLELMAQLQHQGAATGLIDFTRQPSVALWFACKKCRKKEKEDGAVYVLPRSETKEIRDPKELSREIGSFYAKVNEENKLRSWDVSGVGDFNRIIAQSSVLVFGVPTIYVNQNDKADYQSA